MEQITDGMPLCSHCGLQMGLVQFPNVPGLFCVTCAREIKRQLYEPGTTKTWPELVAATLKDE